MRLPSCFPRCKGEFESGPRCARFLVCKEGEGIALQASVPGLIGCGQADFVQSFGFALPASIKRCPSRLLRLLCYQRDRSHRCRCDELLSMHVVILCVELKSVAVSQSGRLNGDGSRSVGVHAFGATRSLSRSNASQNRTESGGRFFVGTAQGSVKDCLHFRSRINLANTCLPLRDSTGGNAKAIGEGADAPAHRLAQRPGLGSRPSLNGSHATPLALARPDLLPQGSPRFNGGATEVRCSFISRWLACGQAVDMTSDVAACGVCREGERPFPGTTSEAALILAG